MVQDLVLSSLPVDWEKHIFDGITHLTLRVGEYQGDVYLNTSTRLWGWKVLDLRTMKIQPRGFGHEGQEEDARSMAETLMKNLTKEEVEGPLKDVARRQKVARAK